MTGPTGKRVTAAGVAGRGRSSGVVPARGYRGEMLVLALVAVTVLANLYPVNTQDVTRLSLSMSVVHRQTLDVDPFHWLMLDRSYRAGHWYSDKAPGMSFLAIPANEVLRAIDEARGGPHVFVWRRVGQLWALRVVTGGLALLVGAFLVGRAAEALVRGTGAATAVTFALGTIAGPLGPTMTEHGAAAALAFAAFLLAWRRPERLIASGLLAGTAVVFEYQAAIVCAVLAAYVALRGGTRGLGRYALGLLPPALVLGAYNTAAFGSPFHFSYSYVSNQFTQMQRRGFFGVTVPSVHGLWLTLFGDRGLVAVSPVALAAGAGLVLLYRRGLRLEALAAAVVVLGFLVIESGYFDPYGAPRRAPASSSSPCRSSRSACPTPSGAGR
jgi:hypothetical protein